MDFPYDIFMQMYEGNMTAWLAFELLITVVALIVLFGVVWWKMPQPAKKLFLNNLFGHRPVVFTAYDNKVLVAETPRIFREGFLHDKHSGWHFVPRLTKDADNILNSPEQELINKTFSIQGAPGQAYVAYAGKGTIVNEELEAVMEYPQLFKSNKKGNPDRCVYVNRKAFIDALTQMKDEFIKIKPVWITVPLDPRRIKEYLSKAFSKSQLLAQEIEIMEEMRDEYRGNVIKLVAILGVITLLAVIAVAVKVFGFI